MLIYLAIIKQIIILKQLFMKARKSHKIHYIRNEQTAKKILSKKKISNRLKIQILNQIPKTKIL